MLYLFHDSGRNQTAADESTNQHVLAPDGTGGGGRSMRGRGVGGGGVDYYHKLLLLSFFCQKKGRMP